MHAHPRSAHALAHADRIAFPAFRRLRGPVVADAAANAAAHSCLPTSPDFPASSRAHARTPALAHARARPRTRSPTHALADARARPRTRSPTHTLALTLANHRHRVVRRSRCCVAPLIARAAELPSQIAERESVQAALARADGAKTRETDAVRAAGVKTAVIDRTGAARDGVVGAAQATSGRVGSATTNVRMTVADRAGAARRATAWVVRRC